MAPRFANQFDVLDGNDGSPQTVTEFDNSPHDEQDVFFSPDEAATEIEKKRCLILNYIHKNLWVKMDRFIPYRKEGTPQKLDDDAGDDNPETQPLKSYHVEIYHREMFQGVELEVCVYWDPDSLDDEGRESCIAVVRDPKEWYTEGFSAFVGADSRSNNNGDFKNDPFSKKVEKSKTHYWTPRWNCVVRLLREQMTNSFYKNGKERPPPLPKPVKKSEKKAGKGGKGEKREMGHTQDKDNENEKPKFRFEKRGRDVILFMEVPHGCIGKIIGPKGVTSSEIKEKTGAQRIDLPKKDDNPGLKPRDLVEIKISGPDQASVEAAGHKVQEIVDNWLSQGPPPKRGESDGGNDSGGGYSNDKGDAGDGWGGDNGGGNAGSWGAPAADENNDTGGNAGGWGAPSDENNDTGSIAGGCGAPSDEDEASESSTDFLPPHSPPRNRHFIEEPIHSIDNLILGRWTDDGPNTNAGDQW